MKNRVRGLINSRQRDLVAMTVCTLVASVVGVAGQSDASKVIKGSSGKAAKTVVSLEPKEMTNSIGMKLIFLPPGKFTMGSPSDEQDRREDEGPAREVEITKGYYVGSHEVTRGQFERFTRDERYKAQDTGLALGFDSETKFLKVDEKYTWQNPGFSQTASHPVMCITFEDAMAFCRWLSRKEGKKYDLPTEAEWEYACRAGTKTRYSCGNSERSLEEFCNLADASFKALVNPVEIKNWTIASWKDGHAFTAPVGSFKPNALDLYDMHGNVWEWCKDWYKKDYYAEAPVRDPQGPATGTHRVSRGGSFINDAGSCRSAYRASGTPTHRSMLDGFRVVLRSP